MKNLSIGNKLILLLLLPLLGLFGYSMLTAQRNYQHWYNLAQTNDLMRFAVALGNLNHYLQVERGATAGFVQSHGEKFSQDLPKYRAETDQNLEQMKDRMRQINLAALPDVFRKEIEAAQEKLNELKAHREAVSQFKISAAEAAAYYTKTVALLLKAMSEITQLSADIEVSRRMFAYQSFLDAKERMGQERALMVPVFTADKIDPAQYRAFLGHISAQAVHLEHFVENAMSDEMKVYQDKETGGYTSEVESMRKVIVDKVAEGGFGVAPTKWFAATTARINAMKEVEDLVANNIQNLSEKGAMQARFSMVVSVIFGLVTITLTLLFGGWIRKGILGPVQTLNQTICLVQKDNDLTRRVEVLGKDELAQAGAAFNQLMGTIQQIVRSISMNTGRVRQSAQKVAVATSQITESSQLQSDAAASMAATMEEMTVSIDQVAEHAKEAHNSSLQNGELSTKGSKVILEVVQDMHSIADTVKQSSVIIRDLGKQSDEIFSIVQVIKDIADQTNLLALNAAIEAARAGEQGRGFAVVADEVRKLAERTSQSTQTITEIVAKIQNGTKNAVKSMEEGVSQVNQGVELAGQAGSSIQQINAGAQRVTMAVSDISSAIKEQSIASNDIARNVERVAQMSDENHGAVGEAAAVARSLESLAAELEGTVAVFKV